MSEHSPQKNHKYWIWAATLSLAFWASLYLVNVFDVYRPYLNGIERQIDAYYSTESELRQCHKLLGIRSSLEDWHEIRESCESGGYAEDFQHIGRRQVEIGTHMIFLSATELEYRVRRNGTRYREVWTVGKLGLVKAKSEKLGSYNP